MLRELPAAFLLVLLQASAAALCSALEPTVLGVLGKGKYQKEESSTQPFPALDVALCDQGSV